MDIRRRINAPPFGLPTSTRSRSRPAPSTRAFTANLFTCQAPPHTRCPAAGLCPTRAWSPRLACPPGSADGVIYCYQTLEHIKHFITCQSAASNNSPAGPARQQTQRRRKREEEEGRKGKNDYALCQKPATRAGQTSALRVSVRQDLTGQSGQTGQAGTNRDKPGNRDNRVKLHQSM